MTTEAKQAQVAAMAATDAANKIKWAKQRIEIGQFILSRHDENNWKIVFKGKHPTTGETQDPTKPWYYGTLVGALKDLPKKIMNEAEFKDLRDILETVHGIEKEIDRLYYTKFKAE